MIHCHDCKKEFTPDPRFRLQIYCYKCRDKCFLAGSGGSPLKSLHLKDDLILIPGFIGKLMNPGETYGQFCRRIKPGVTPATLRIWDSSGRVPYRDGGVMKLCKALNMSKTELEQRFGR